MTNPIDKNEDEIEIDFLLKYPPKPTRVEKPEVEK